MRSTTTRCKLLVALGLPLAFLGGHGLGAVAPHVPSEPPLVVVFAPHFGALDLQAGLSATTDPRDCLPPEGIRRLALREGWVVRRVTGLERQTTTATIGALLSGRHPEQTGAVMRDIASEHRRHSESRRALSHSVLGHSFLRQRPLRPTLALGLPDDLLPLRTSTWRWHEHGAARHLDLDRRETERATIAGWRLPGRLGSSQALSVDLDVPGGDSPARARLDVLLPPDGSAHLSSSRDAVHGLLPRSGNAQVVRAPMQCLESGLYHDQATALVRVDGVDEESIRIRLSPFVHAVAEPPQLGRDLGAAPPRACAETHHLAADLMAVDVLRTALGVTDLGPHPEAFSRLIAVLPAGCDTRALDIALGKLAQRVLERGGTLVVVGLPSGKALRRSVDLEQELHLRLGAADWLRVHAEDSRAQLEIRSASRRRELATTRAITELLGEECSVTVHEGGRVTVRAPPGVALRPEPPTCRPRVCGGSDEASVFAVGSGVERSLDLRADWLAAHHALSELWATSRREP